MARVAADRHLLFGLLALQNGLINQGAARRRVPGLDLRQVAGPGRPPEPAATSTRHKRARRRGAGRLHLEAHGGDVEKSLAAVPANRSTRASLAELGEPEIEATLARVARAKDGQATELDDDDDPERTAAFPSARPPATASGSASFGPTHAAGWARCSWRSTPSYTARWR